MTKNKRIGIMAIVIIMLCSFTLAFTSFFANATNNEKYSKSDIIQVDSGVKKIVCGEEFYEQFHVYNESLVAEKEQAMTVEKSYSGIGVYSSGGTIKFSYKNAINFSEKTAEDCLVEIYPMFGNNYAKIIDIQITLTDTQDASNTIAIHYDDSKDGLAIYSRILYKNKDIAYQPDRANPIYNGIRGIYLQNCAYSGIHYQGSKAVEWQKGEISPFSMYLDYEERKVLSSYYTTSGVYTQKTILDLDDAKHVGAGYEWEGFTDDTAFMSVLVTFSEAITENKPGGVIVKSIDGVNLDGEFVNENEIPSPIIKPNTFDEYGDSLPYGAVGVDYDIPSIYAYDWFFGIADDAKISYFIEKFNGNSYDETSYKGGNGGSHKFASIGKYRIKYVVNNGVKTSEFFVYFEIKEELLPIIISQVTEYQKPELNKFLIIPETVVSGGSGNLYKKETLYYNGQQIELNKNRDVLVDKAGIISLMVEVEGYTGGTFVKYFPVKVKDGTVILVENMPKVIMGNNSEYLTLPEATAYNTADNSKMPVTIMVDGKIVPEDRVISTEKTEGFLSIVYSAGDAVKEYQIQIIESNPLEQKPSTYIIKNGNIDVLDTIGGILLETSENGAGVTWGYPVVTQNGSSKMNFVLSQTSEKLDFKYIDVILSDAKEQQKDFYIRIYKDYAMGYSITQTTVNLNGMNENFSMSGSINNQGGVFRFSIDSNVLYNSSGNLVYDFSNIYNAKLSYVTVKFGGVDGQASIRLDTISNQALSYDEEHGWLDASAVLSFSDKLAVSSIVSLNTVFNLPSCDAYDLTSKGASVNVTVTAPDGVTKIFNRESVSKSLSFIASELGEYTIVFSVIDGYGNSARNTYTVKVVDTVNPILEINGILKSEIPIGKMVELPSAIATDAEDGICNVVILVRNLSDYGLYIAENGKYTFEKVGKYEVIYQTHDLSYNYTQYIFTITVTEK